MSPLVLILLGVSAIAVCVVAALGLVRAGARGDEQLRRSQPPRPRPDADPLRLVLAPLGWATPTWAGGDKVAVVSVARGNLDCARCRAPIKRAVDAAEGWLGLDCCGQVESFHLNGSGERIFVSRRPPR